MPRATQHVFSLRLHTTLSATSTTTLVTAAVADAFTPPAAGSREASGVTQRYRNVIQARRGTRCRRESPLPNVSTLTRPGKVPHALRPGFASMTRLTNVSVFLCHATDDSARCARVVAETHNHPPLRIPSPALLLDPSRRLLEDRPFAVSRNRAAVRLDCAALSRDQGRRRIRVEARRRSAAHPISRAVHSNPDASLTNVLLLLTTAWHRDQRGEEISAHGFLQVACDMTVCLFRQRHGVEPSTDLLDPHRRLETEHPALAGVLHQCLFNRPRQGIAYLSQQLTQWFAAELSESQRTILRRLRAEEITQ